MICPDPLMQIALKLEAIRTLVGPEAAADAAEDCLLLLQEPLDNLRSIGKSFRSQEELVAGHNRNSFGPFQSIALGPFLLIDQMGDDAEPFSVCVVPSDRLIPNPNPN
jgi:hypothetical protein